MHYASSIVDACRAFARKHGRKWSAGSNRQGHLRLCAPGPQGRDVSYCPLTAACMEKTGHFHDTGSWSAACTELGVPKEIGQQVVNAADCCSPDQDMRTMLLGCLNEGGESSPEVGTAVAAEDEDEEDDGWEGEDEDEDEA